jgi:uncharacterized low-complexity protein
MNRRIQWAGAAIALCVAATASAQKKPDPNAYTDQQIAIERAAREAADVDLNGKIEAEKSARSDADAALSRADATLSQWISDVDAKTAGPTAFALAFNVAGQQQQVMTSPRFPGYTLTIACSGSAEGVSITVQGNGFSGSSQRILTIAGSALVPSSVLYEAYLANSSDPTLVGVLRARSFLTGFNAPYTCGGALEFNVRKAF